jgi:hypothetical protein
MVSPKQMRRKLAVAGPSLLNFRVDPIVRLFYVPRCSPAYLFLDDTCVQHGYWAEVAEFVTSLLR